MNTTSPSLLGEPDQLIFVHIPKTAGTALGTYLERHFAPDQIVQVVNMSPQELDPGYIARYALVRGHFFFNLISQLVTRPAAYMTMLRDPVECVLSHYAHIQRYEPFPRYAVGTGMDLEEFIFHPLAVHRITNLQTRMLAAPLRFAGPSRVFKALEIEEARHIIGKGPSAEQAIAALHQMAYFGITESFAKSLALLAHTFGWPPAEAVPSENVAPARMARADIAPHVLERIIELNQEDIQLYEYGQRLFNDRFSSVLGALLEDDYQRAQSGRAAVPRHAGKHVRAATGAKESNPPW